MPNFSQKRIPPTAPGRPSPPRGTGGWWWQAALILLVGWWAFAPAFHGGWLWDDPLEITDNPELRDLDGLRNAWFAPMTSDYFPLKTTVQWVLWRCWHDQPAGYHLTSAGLHLLSALLLWHLFKKLGIRLAWFGGLLFALHPVTVESVAWIAELKNTLSLPLLLLAMCAWIDYDNQGRRSDHLRAVLFFLAAMLCKSAVVMFPAVLLLYAWWKRGRITWKDFKASAAFFAISLILGLVTVWFQSHRAINWVVIPIGGFLSRLACAGLALSFYSAKAVLPARLIPIYPQWVVNPPAPVQFLPWLGLGAVGWVLWKNRTGWGRHAPVWRRQITVHGLDFGIPAEMTGF